MIDFSSLPENLKFKVERAFGLIQASGPSLLAVSGGLDSRFLSWLAWEGGLNHEAVFFSGPHLAESEIHYARRWLEGRAPGWSEIAVSPLTDEAVRRNAKDRCYHCKYALFSRALEVARERGFAGVMDGTNASDLATYRPGIRALKELGVQSPLAGAGLTKGEIRLAGRLLGLPEPEQPARPCLLTRFGYGVSADEETLARIGRCEDALAALGFTDFRLRVPADGRFVLQLGEGDKSRWEKKGGTAREAFLREGISVFETVVTQSVSGWYDRGNSPRS